MALHLSQVMRQSQRLVMTPQMQQSIQLLQMNSMELEQHLNNELMENPFLEAAENGEEEDQLTVEGTDNADAGEGNDHDSDSDGGDDRAERDADGSDSDSGSDGEDYDAADRNGTGDDDPYGDVAGDAGELPSLHREELSPSDNDSSSKDKESSDVSDGVDSAADVDLDQMFDDRENYTAPSSYDPNVEDNDFTTYTAAQDSARDKLMWQLSMSSLDEKEREVGEYIIGLLDDDGYLRTSMEDIAEEFGLELPDLEDIIAVIQEFEPAGIAARDIRECLMLQMEALGQKDRAFYRVVRDHFDLLQAKKFRDISKETGLDESKISEIFHYVSKLNPKPGRKLIPHQVRHIRPDVFVKDIDGDYIYYLNEGRSGRLRINHYYRDLIKRRGTGMFSTEEKEFTVGKYKNAVWLMKNIEKRKETILRVTEAIMNYQRDFLDKGIDHLRPLTLKTIAAIVGMHESTIARVTTGKYVETPRGTFELKFFFSSALETEDGEDASSRSIKQRIRTIIDEENTKKPLSDQKIADMLQEGGIKIARRTVAKYREQMKILPAKLRKAV